MRRSGALRAAVLCTGVALATAACAAPAASDAGTDDADSAPASASASASAAAAPGTSANATATESPPDSTSEIAGPWVPVLDEGQAGRVNRLYDVALVGSRLIAVGESVHTTVIHSGPYERDGMIWVSEDDGATWRPPDAFPPLAGKTLNRVVAVGDEAFVFGYGAQVLRSRDGVSWEASDLPGFSADGWLLSDIAGGPLGWVMIGERLPSDGSAGERQIWFSSDWETWELTRRAPGQSDDHLAGQESYRDVGAGPEGFVVTGTLTGVGDPMALMLASSDGRTWEVAPEQPALAHGMEPLWVAPIAGDWVAAGTDFAGVGSPIWKSTNGLSWEIVTAVQDPQGRDEFGWGRHIVSTADRLFLSTWLQGLFAELEAGVWTSVDGAEWELLDLGAGASVSSAVWLRDRWILAGHVGGAESNATIWTTAGP